MYSFDYQNKFIKNAEKLIKKRILTKEGLASTLKKMAQDPFAKGLRTHKANIKNISGLAYSSWVTGDYRIIWDFVAINRIVLLTIDSHKVYQ